MFINKTYTRYLDGFFFIDCYFRMFLFGFVLSNLSFPGSINFVGEILALISIVQIDWFFIIIFLVVRFLSCFYWSLVMNRKLPYYLSCCYSSSNWIEFAIPLQIILLLYCLGFILLLYIRYWLLFFMSASLVRLDYSVSLLLLRLHYAIINFGWS